jgi:Na+/H+ antiporter NhaC
MDVATANNTVAIVMAGPIAKNISEEYGISARKSASILDIFGSVVQGIIPYGAQMITAVALTGVSAMEIIPLVFYPYLLAISAIVFMFIPSLKYTISNAHKMSSDTMDISKNIKSRVRALMISALFFFKNATTSNSSIIYFLF